MMEFGKYYDFKWEKRVLAMMRVWEFRHKVTKSYDEESGSSYDHSVDGYTQESHSKNN